MKAEMEEQRRLLEQMQKDKDEYAEKLAAQQAELNKKKQDQALLQTRVHLKNINSDPTMSGMIKKALKNADNYMGKQTKEFVPDIPISGVGISAQHCLIQYAEDSNKTTIYPNSEDPEKYSIKVNGV